MEMGSVFQPKPSTATDFHWAHVAKGRGNIHIHNNFFLAWHSERPLVYIINDYILINIINLNLFHLICAGLVIYSIVMMTRERAS